MTAATSESVKLERSSSRSLKKFEHVYGEVLRKKAEKKARSAGGFPEKTSAMSTGSMV